MKFKRNILQRPAKADLWSTIERVSEFVGVTKDTIDLLFRIAPFSLVAAGLFLWLYLQSIGWSTLFYESAMSGSGLLFLVMAALFFALGSILLAVVPSLLVGATSHVFHDLERTIPEVVLRMYQVPLLAWCVFFVANFFVPDWFPFYLTLLGPLLVALVTGTLLRKQLKLHEGDVGLNWPTIWRVVLFSVLTTSSVIAACFPLLLALRVALEFKGLSTVEQSVTLVGCLVVAIAGGIPGYIYLRMRTKHTGSSRPFTMAIGGVVYLGYILMSLAIALPPVRSMFLKGADVYSNQAEMYRVLDDKLPALFDAAGIVTVEKDGVHWVTAYRRFSFADTLLLCKAPFESAEITTAQMQKAREGNSPPPGILAGYNCVPVKADEVRHIKGDPPPHTAQKPASPSNGRTP